MARPQGTYVSTVFNFGIDPNIPFGFVDVVFDRTGNAVGFEKDGKFYNLGDKVAKAPAKPLNAKQLSNKIDLLKRKLDLNKTQASNRNISDAERNKYISEYRKTSEELSKLERSLVETQVKEGKIAEQDSTNKAADVLRFEIRRLKEQQAFLSKIGSSTLDIDNQILQKQDSLKSLLNPTPIVTKPSPQNVVPEASLPFGGRSITGTKIPQSGTLPTGGTGTGAGTGTGTSTGAGTGIGAGKGTGTGTGITEDTDKRTAEQRYTDAVLKAQELYNMPDIIFKNVPSLGAILKRYVNKELTDEQFRREIQNDTWYRQNSKEIQARYVQLFNYEDLVKSGQAQGTTNYEQEITRITRLIQSEARKMRGAEIDDADARLIAKDLYIFNLDRDGSIVRERIARFIKPVAGMIGGQGTTGYGGEALQNYQVLQGLARANGYKISDILPKDLTGKPMTAEETLRQIALGKIDVNRIAQDIRKMAAIGQPDFVKELLGQGYNLEDIYAPYKRRMASILELDENAIDLRDPSLQMAISKNGDTNLYDYEKALRQDSRWQYTKNAREEVSSMALQILRDFGFQG